MSANFYDMIFVEDNLLPFIRKGMPITATNDSVCINGLGKYRIFNEIKEINDNDNIEEKFEEYSARAPWIGRENDGITYIYRAQINEDNLNFEEFNADYTYLHLKAKPTDRITILNGKIFYRNFIAEEQSALIKFTKNTVLRVEKDEGLIIIELVDGKFICR